MLHIAVMMLHHLYAASLLSADLSLHACLATRASAAVVKPALPSCALSSSSAPSRAWSTDVVPRPSTVHSSAGMRSCIAIASSLHGYLHFGLGPGGLSPSLRRSALRTGLMLLCGSALDVALHSTLQPPAPASLASAGADLESN